MFSLTIFAGNLRAAGQNCACVMFDRCVLRNWLLVYSHLFSALGAENDANIKTRGELVLSVTFPALLKHDTVVFTEIQLL